MKMISKSYMSIPFIALIVWIPFVLFLFRRLPPRIAILFNFLGGWALLPGADYTPSTADFPFWVQGVCIPTTYLLTKASVIGAAGMVGVLSFHRADFKKLRLGWLDLPLVVWCCVPIVASIAHPGTLQEGFRNAAYQTLAWAVPWFLGRIYFSDYGSLALAARAFIIAALLYVPICIFELLAGPQVYAFVYGYQPYRWVGAHRYLGFRPIGMMEDGNQLGIWMAVATLLAISMLRGRLADRILGLPISAVAAGLLTITLLCQSVGSILILLLILPIVLFKRRTVFLTYLAALLLCIVGLASIRVTGLLHLRDLEQKSPVLSAVAGGLNRIGRHSFEWRIAREEDHLRTALRYPLLGSGQWNWWQNGDFRPWSMWLLVLGTYGAVGLVAFESVLILPILRAAWSADDPAASCLRRAVIGLILVLAIDQFLNGTLILPYLLLIGGLGALDGRARTALPEQSLIVPPREMQALRSIDALEEQS